MASTVWTGGKRDVRNGSGGSRSNTEHEVLKSRNSTGKKTKHRGESPSREQGSRERTEPSCPQQVNSPHPARGSP